MYNNMNNNTPQFDNEFLKKAMIFFGMFVVVALSVYGFRVLPTVLQVNYAVKFNPNNGESLTVVSVEKNEKVEAPLAPTMQDYEFVGWAYEGNLFDFESKVTKHMELEAIWKPIGAVEENNPNSEVIYSNNTNDKSQSTPIAKPTGARNVATNKKNNDNSKSVATKKEQIERYKIIYETNGADKIDDVMVAKYGVVPKPKNPVLKGYKFMGWYYNNIPYDFDLKVISDMILIAVWEKEEDKQSSKNSDKNTNTNPTNNNSNTNTNTNKSTNKNTKTNAPKKDVPSVPSISYVGGANTHEWKNNYKINLSSSSETGIKYYEIDIDGNATVDARTGSYYEPGNGLDSCNVRFRAVSNIGDVSGWTAPQHIHSDTEAPSKTTVDTGSYRKGTWTNGNTTINRNFYATDNIGVHHFEWSNSECTNYAGSEATTKDQYGIERPVTSVPLSGFQENVVCHRAVDYAGNAGPWSDVTRVYIGYQGFQNKKAVFFGDSVQYGTGPEVWESTRYAWSDYIKNNSNIARTDNFAVPGSCVHRNTIGSNSNGGYNIPCGTGYIADQLDGKSSDYNYVILEGGVNDSYSYINLGITSADGAYYNGVFDQNDFSGNYNVDTFWGGIENYIYKAVTKYPNAKIGYIILYKTSHFKDRGTIAARNDQLKIILNKWKIPYLDLYDDTFSNKVSNHSVYMPDDVHVNRAGYDVLGPDVLNWMLNLPTYSSVKSF